MAKKNLLARVRIELGYPTQAALARDMRISQQAVSHAERLSEVPQSYRDKIAALLETKPREVKEKVLGVLEGGPRFEAARQSEDVGAVKKDWGPAIYEPIERQAWPWALKFRNQCILDRLGSLASRNGFTCERIRDGVKVKRSRHRRSEQRYQDALFVQPRRFGLKKTGTVVVLGAAYRHYLAREIFQEIAGRMNLDLRIEEFSADEPSGKPFYPFYFGYQTVLKYLSVDGQLYRPSRYADHQAIYYEDFGAILNSPLYRITRKGEEPFGRDASRLVLIAGLHRLATGVGARLLEDESLRRALLAGQGCSVPNGPDYDFESDSLMGALVYRVVVRHDQWRSTIERLQVLYAATDPSPLPRPAPSETPDPKDSSF